MGEQPTTEQVEAKPVNEYQAKQDAQKLVDAELIRRDAARNNDAMLALPTMRSTCLSLRSTYVKETEAIDSLLQQ